MKAFLFLVSLLMAVPAYALTDSELQKFEGGIQAIQKEDYKMARDMLFPLAEKGHAQSQFQIGWMHINGLGAPLNVCAGITWIDKAARQGLSSAQLSMADVISDISWGIRPDYKRAYGWLLTAINNGITNSKKNQSAHLNDIQPLLKQIRGQLTEAEEKKIKQEVADGHFDYILPADTYVVHLREVHIGDRVVKIPPCPDEQPN